jgi:hypothetical protein
MATLEFDKKFQKLTTEMVEIAFEYARVNKEEVDAIYIFGSMEDYSFFYNVFYIVNNILTKKQDINEFLKYKVDDSSEQQQNLMRTGNKLLLETSTIFREDEREVPTLLKMIYFPKTGKFKCDISYELNYSNHPEWTNVDIFNKWFDEIKSQEIDT